MTRRIIVAIVGVTALVMALLGIPLALAVRASIRDAEVVRAHETAARTLVEILVPLDPAQLHSITTEQDAPPPFTVYDTNGNRVTGDGPATADEIVSKALTGSTVTRTTSRSILVAAPIVDHTNEHTVGVLRSERSLGPARHRIQLALTIMAAAALAALVLAWVLALRLAVRLTRPVAQLAGDADRLGAGEAIPQRPPSGISELDTLAVALHHSGHQLIEALGRERRLTADIAHQLRTPITAMRLHLEQLQQGGRTNTVGALGEDLDRLQITVEHLLDVARNETTATTIIELDRLATDTATEWRPRFNAAARRISVTSTPTEADASERSLRQALDVLVDNALTHGTGDVVITVRTITGGAAIDVTDQGTELAGIDAEQPFRRGEGHGNGIGLALARGLIERDGGRLRLTRRSPTTFTVTLLSHAGFDHESPEEEPRVTPAQPR